MDISHLLKVVYLVVELVVRFAERKTMYRVREIFDLTSPECNVTTKCRQGDATSSHPEFLQIFYPNLAIWKTEWKSLDSVYNSYDVGE